MSDETLDLKHENERLRATLREVGDKSLCEGTRTMARLALARLPSRQNWTSWQLRRIQIQLDQEQAINEHLTEALATTMAMIGYIRDKRMTADEAWKSINAEINFSKVEVGE